MGWLWHLLRSGWQGQWRRPVLLHMEWLLMFLSTSVLPGIKRILFCQAKLSFWHLVSYSWLFISNKQLSNCSRLVILNWGWSWLSPCSGFMLKLLNFVQCLFCIIANGCTKMCGFVWHNFIQWEKCWKYYLYKSSRWLVVYSPWVQ